jgi:predicted phage replisome organizer
MADNEKYFWLKFYRDFFKRHDIRIIEKMPDGKEYIIFYLKMLLESIDHEGTLRYSETMPYDEEMLSVVLDTDIKIVKAAMQVFIKFELIQIHEDKTIYMTKIEKLIGSETKWAKKKREQRQKGDNVPQVSSKCPTEIELEKETEIDKEIEVDVVEEDSSDNHLKCLGGKLGKGVVFLSENQIGKLLDKLGSIEVFDKYVEKLANFIIDKNASVANHYETILNWYDEDTKV